MTTSSLLRVATHQRLLDRFGGLEAQRDGLAEQVRQLRATRRELDALLRDENELARRVDQLNYQVEEYPAAQLRPDEEEELTGERARLANAERLAQLADEVFQASVRWHRRPGVRGGHAQPGKAGYL